MRGSKTHPVERMSGYAMAIEGAWIGWVERVRVLNRVYWQKESTRCVNRMADDVLIRWQMVCW